MLERNAPLIPAHICTQQSTHLKKLYVCSSFNRWSLLNHITGEILRIVSAEVALIDKFDQKKVKSLLRQTKFRGREI